MKKADILKQYDLVIDGTTIQLAEIEIKLKDVTGEEWFDLMSTKLQTVEIRDSYIKAKVIFLECYVDAEDLLSNNK